MRKRNLALILCMAVILCGCGKSAEIQDREVTMQEPETVEKVPEESSAEEKVPMEADNITEDTMESEPEQQESEEENQYVIYKRFLDGEEPLYFREAIWGWDQNPEAGEAAMLEAGKPYRLKEICSMINMYDNSDTVFDEMRQLRYAYIDCGADGDMELALSFNKNAMEYLVKLMAELHVHRKEELTASGGFFAFKKFKTVKKEERVKPNLDGNNYLHHVC